MTLLWLLIFANLIGGIIAAWAFIEHQTPDVGRFSNIILNIKLPVGILVLLISLINIFNFGSPHYPKLTLVAGLLLGIVLSINLIKKLNLAEATAKSIINFAGKIQILLGMVSIIIGCIWVIHLVFSGLIKIL